MPRPAPGSRAAVRRRHPSRLCRALRAAGAGRGLAGRRADPHQRGDAAQSVRARSSGRRRGCATWRCCRAPRPTACMSGRSPCRRARIARRCTSSRTSTGTRSATCASAQTGKAWRWSILRPVLIVGDSVGSAMNVIPALGVYAAMMRRAGKTRLDYPGGVGRVAQAVDADLLARAIAWSGEAATARNEIFNVTNGDVFVWPNVWPAIADALGFARRRARAAGARQRDPPARGGVGRDPRARTGSGRARSRSSSGCRSSMPTTRWATAATGRARRRSSRPSS